MNLFANVIDAWRTVRADRLFPDAVSPQDAMVAECFRTGQIVARTFPTPDTFAQRMLEVAIAQLGCGETSNNCGPDVERYVAPAKTPANWCAGFVGWCGDEVARLEGMPLPFKRSLGAKRLGENIAAVGRKFTDPSEARPGDAMVFHRGAQGSWMGHIAMVERVEMWEPHNRTDATDVNVHTVEGNHGPKVHRGVRRVGSDRFAFFASLRHR